MRVYFDSSVFAKRYLYEPGTDVVLAWCEKARELVLSVQFLRFFAQRLTEEYLLKQQFIMSFDVVGEWSKWRKIGANGVTVTIQNMRCKRLVHGGWFGD